MRLCSVKPHGNVPLWFSKWGLAARRSKANEEAVLVEREVCFILEAGSCGGGGGLLSND